MTMENETVYLIGKKWPQKEAIRNSETQYHILYSGFLFTQHLLNKVFPVTKLDINHKRLKYYQFYPAESV